MESGKNSNSSIKKDVNTEQSGTKAPADFAGDIVNGKTGDYIEENPRIECEICKIQFSGLDPYEHHTNGKKHFKMVKKLQMMRKFNNQRNDDGACNGKDSETAGNNSTESAKIHCLVCKLQFSGCTPYFQHMESSVHHKNVSKKELKAQFQNMPEVLDKEASDNAKSSKNSGYGVMTNLKSYARCDICKKSFSGPEPFQQHIIGGSHKKKISQSKVKQAVQKNLEQLPNPEVVISCNENSDQVSQSFAQCKTCQKYFSGPESFQQHMQSPAHQKQLQKIKTRNEMMPFAVSTESEEERLYICKECSRNFNDPSALQIHFASNSHTKQKIKNEIVAFLEKYGEIAQMTSGNIKNGLVDVEDDGNNPQADYFVCNICHKCFSGPESAKAHVESRKHLKAKLQMQKMEQFRTGQHLPTTEDTNSVTPSANLALPTHKTDQVEDPIESMRIGAQLYGSIGSNGKVFTNAESIENRNEGEHHLAAKESPAAQLNSNLSFQQTNKNHIPDGSDSVLSDNEFELV